MVTSVLGDLYKSVERDILFSVASRRDRCRCRLRTVLPAKLMTDEAGGQDGRYSKNIEHTDVSIFAY